MFLCPANCPQNLVRTLKLLKPRAQMALENASSFQYMIYHKLLVETNLALKKLRAHNLLIPGAKMVCEIVGLFQPL